MSANFKVTALEFHLFDDLNRLLDQNPPLELHKGLYDEAYYHAKNVLTKKVKTIKEGCSERRQKFKSAKRYSEICFISIPIMPESNQAEDNSPNSNSQISTENKNNGNSITLHTSKVLAEMIRKKYNKEITMGMNSIGPVLFQMKSKKILTVILLAFFQPAVPMSLFKETFEPLCSSEVLVSENNFAFFLSLINQFRSIAKFDDLIPKPTVKKVTSLKVAKYEVSCKITYSIQLFQNLISDPNFFRILTDFCHTFSIKSETINFDEFRLFMEFWNDENTYIEYIVNVTIVPEIKKAVVYLEQEITKNNEKDENRKEKVGGQDEPIPFMPEKPKFGETEESATRWRRISDAVEEAGTYDDDKDHENIPKELRKSHKTVVQPIPIESKQKLSEIVDIFVDEAGISERSAKIQEETLSHLPSRNEEIEMNTKQEENKEQKGNNNEQENKKETIGGQDEPIPFNSEKIFEPSQKVKKWHRISDAIENGPQYDDSEDVENISKELRKTHKTQIVQSIHEKVNKSTEIEDEFVDEDGIIERTIQLTEELNIQPAHEENKSVEIKNGVEPTKNVEESQNESDLKFGGQNEPVQFESEKVFLPNEKKERWHRISDSVEEKGKYDDSEDLEHIPKELRKSHKTQIASPSTTKTNKPIEEIEDEFVDEAGIISRSIQLEEELETEENIEDERNSEEKPIKQTSERRTKDQNKPKPSRKERVAARVAREAAAAENALKDEENQENSKTNKLPPKPKGNNPYANIASALGITEVPKSTNNQFQQHQGTPVQQKKPVDRHDTPVQPKKVPTNKQDTPVQQKKQAANRQDTPIQQKTIPLIRKDTPIQQKNVPYVPANAVSWGELKLDPNSPSEIVSPPKRHLPSPPPPQKLFSQEKNQSTPRPKASKGSHDLIPHPPAHQQSSKQTPINQESEDTEAKFEGTMDQNMNHEKPLLKPPASAWANISASLLMSKEDKHEKKQQIRQKPVPFPLPNPVPIQQTPVVNIEEIVVTETFAPVVTGQNAHTVHDKIEIEQIIEPISVLSPHQQNSASIWAQISPTEFDDKHEFRKLPAELKRSHKVRSPVKDSINQQDEEENSTPKQQKEKENKKSKSTPKRHKKIEQIQNEKEEFIVENRIEDMEDSDIPKPVFPTTEEVQEISNQKPIAIIENQASPWREIRQALSVAEPFDDKHEVRKLAPELRRSHTKQIQQQEIAPTSTINEVEENGGRKSGKQHSPKHEKKQNQQKKAQNQRFEEEVFTSNHEPIHSQHVIASKDIIVNDSKVENLSPTKPIKQSAWSVALEEVEAPYDDSKDVRKLPPQLRRTHQNQTLQTEEKKSSESSKKEKKEKQTKQQNTLKSTKKNKNVEKNIEIPEKIKEDKIAPQSLSPTISSAWANLTIRPESPKSTLKTAPKPVQTVAVPVVTAVEPVVTVAEPVLNLNHEVEKDENIEEETYSPRTLPKIDPTNPWTLLTEEELVKPKILTPNTKSSPKATKQVLEDPKEEEIQEPIQVQEIIEPVMKDEIKEENVLEEEEVSFEVQDLKPSPEKVKAWAVLSPSDKYDDSRDYRKTPTELRRSHAKAIQQDKNSPKENEKDDKNESNKNITPKKDKNANKQEKTKKQNKHKNLEQLNNLNQEQENSVNEPFVKEYKEASYSKDPQIEIVQLSPRNETWSLALSQVDAPYDDSRDVNKLPPELRRTHKKNTEILNEQEQTKKSPKNSSKKPEKQKEKNQNKIENQNVKMEISEIKEEIQQKVEEKSPQKINSPWSVALSSHNIPYDDSRDVNKLPPELRRSHKKVEPSEESPQENKQAPKSPRSPKKSSKIKVEAKHEILNQEEKEIQKPESPKLKKDSIWASIQIKPDPPKPTIQKVPQQETRMEVKENLETQKEEETEIIQTEPPKIQENQDSEQKEENSLQKIECEEEEKTEVEIVPTQSLKKPAGPWGTIKIEPFNDARQYGLVPAQLKRSHQIPSPKQEKLESPRNNNQYEKRENEQKRKNGNQQKKNNNNIHKQNFRNNEPHFEEEILNDEELYLTPANEEENPNLQQNIENTPEMPVSPLRRNVASAWVAATSSMKK